MPRSSTAPLTLEVLSIRFLNMGPRDYTVQVASDGVYMRRKGTRTWLGPARWEAVLSAACRQSVRDVDAEPAIARRAGS